jgi:ribosomal protein S18 acetylase RimI-like enzyme
MGVVKDYRRQGIGTKLMERAIIEAKGQGLERIELEVYASNTPAINLYEKRGFNHEGVKRRARKLDGVYDDIIVMALFA